MKSISKKTKATKQQTALDFFAEAGLLKKVRRSGWWVAGIKNPESVAEHSFRCAIMGFYIAHLEKVDPYQVLAMCVFNDIHEARINDLHKMGHYYIDFRNAEEKVFKDQVSSLDEEFKYTLTRIRDNYSAQKTQESLVARDADILECLLQAKEYYDEGFLKAKTFFQQAPKHLKTKTAKSLWLEIKKWDSADWWQRVVKFER